jgi:hypothetical protein
MGTHFLYVGESRALKRGLCQPIKTNRTWSMSPHSGMFGKCPDEPRIEKRSPEGPESDIPIKLCESRLLFFISY